MKKTKNSKSKGHIVDELDLLEIEKYEKIPELPREFPLTTTSASSKNFIRKNIQRNTQFACLKKNTFNSEDLQIKNLNETLSFETLQKKYPNIEERFYKKAEKYKKKQEELKIKIENEEVEGCTFKPKTNVKEIKVISNSEFNKKVEGYVQRKRKKELDAKEKSNIEMQIKEENDENLTLKPKICEKSKEILAKKPSTGVPTHERLYSLNKSQAKKQIELLEREKIDNDSEIDKASTAADIFFQPSINKKSQNLKRDGNISLYLYNDAKRRMNRSLPEEIAAHPKYVSENSQKFLVERFKREYDEEISLLEIKENSLSYSQFLEILSKLFFYNSEKESEKNVCLQLWDILIEKYENAISKEILGKHLLAILGLFEEKSEDKVNSENFTYEDSQVIKKKFEQLSINRSLMKSKISQNKSVKECSDYSFRPEKNLKSEELAEKWRLDNGKTGKIEDMLIEEDIKKREKIQKLKKKIEEDLLKDCTFTPKTEDLPILYTKSENDYSKLMNSFDTKSYHKGLALHNLSQVLKEKKDASYISLKEIQEQKELEECTFCPNYSSKNNKGSIDNFLIRMKEREEYKEQKTTDTRKGFRFDKEKKFKSISEFQNSSKNHNDFRKKSQGK